MLQSVFHFNLFVTLYLKESRHSSINFKIKMLVLCCVFSSCDPEKLTISIFKAEVTRQGRIRHIFPKFWHRLIKPHGAKIQDNTIIIIIAMRNSDLNLKIFCRLGNRCSYSWQK
jgi:hypothetical protein